MLEFIIDTGFSFAVVLLILFAFEFIGERPLKESVESNLSIGIFLTALIASDRADQYQLIVTNYQLIVIGIVLGIAIFLLKFVFGYYVFKRPLKEPVKDGLIKGSIVAILFPILVKSTDLLIFLYDLIV